MEPPAPPAASPTQLIIATLLGIAVVVVLITWKRVDPFLALILGSVVLVGVSGFDAQKGVASFSKGVGDTFGSVGILVALGAIVGRLLIDSGGAGKVVDTIVDRVPGGALPWALAGAAALIGLPMFFEIGVVLLVPIVLLVSRRGNIPVLAVGIPALAGLSVLHGLVPPHPGPLTAIGALKADLGLTLLFGIIIAIPTVIIAGPLFAKFASRFGPQGPPPSSALFNAEDHDHDPDDGRRDERADGPDDGPGSGGVTTRRRTRRSPGFTLTSGVVLLPVVLMLARAVAELVSAKGNPVHDVLFLLGTPVIALLIGTLAAMLLLGIGSGMGSRELSQSVEKALPPMAGTLLIIAAGGGFKQTLVDAGVGDLVADWAKAANVNVLLLGWLVAVGIRLATGSATVATITAAGIVAPLAAGLDSNTVALLALAIGSGSLFFSHVNDAGFWLVKEYFGMSVGETLKTWSAMETIISVVSIVLLLGLDVVV
jgi:GntP family gluconate:H+ symporter